MLLPYWIYRRVKGKIKYIPVKTGGIFVFPGGQKHFRKAWEIERANSNASGIGAVRESKRDT